MIYNSYRNNTYKSPKLKNVTFIEIKDESTKDNT